MTCTVELYAAPHRLIAVHVLSAVDGADAQAAAATEAATLGADFAELYQGDGTGSRLFYATVPAASARPGVS